jgi:neutral amino acid transport system permease protein
MSTDVDLTQSRVPAAPRSPGRSFELSLLLLNRARGTSLLVKSAIGIGALDLALMLFAGVDRALVTWVGVVAVAIISVAVIRRNDRPVAVAGVVLGNIAAVLLLNYGLHDISQRSLNGLSLGAIFALGAVGLTLVYGILRLVNFAHGDYLTFGAYIAYLFNVTLHLPLVVGVLMAIIVTAALGIALERIMWAPMRKRGGGTLQMLLLAIGLAFVLRYGIQFIWGASLRQLDVDRTASVQFLGLRIGRTELIVMLVGIATMVAVGLMLKVTLLGKRMRALSDSIELAETSGIDTSRVILWTWFFAAGLAGLAGVFAGALTQVQPELGFQLLLPIFAAVILGGIGNAFGALVAGLVLGLMIEWSTLFLDSNLKLMTGFVVLIFILIVRPDGIFARPRSV